jgi:hypothetical protein
LTNIHLQLSFIFGDPLNKRVPKNK